MEQPAASILIVDDDESTRKSLALIFGRAGYQTETAASGQEAIAKVQAQPFNLALLDIRLPDIEGIELLANLKQLRPNMVFLIITGYASLKTATRALNYGAAGFLTKPVNMNELLSKIKDVLEKQRLAFENNRLYQALEQELAERTRIEAELRHRNRELTLLNRVIAASVTEQDLLHILEITCRELALAFETTYAAAILVNEKKTIARIVAEYHAPDQPVMLHQELPLLDNPLIEYIEGGLSLVIDNIFTDPRLERIRSSLDSTGPVSVLILPLTINQQVVGTLNVGSAQPRHFSADEVSLATRVADQVSGVVARLQLAQAHQRLFTAIEQTADSVAITDTAGSILYVNPAFERTSGYNQAEVIGQNPRILKSGQQDVNFYKDLWDTITAGNVWQGRLVNKKKNGHLYTEDATISPVRNENGIIVNYVAVKRDITHELQLEAQYLQAQKMELVGQLTGGIAHDFNNLLTAVIGFAELTRMRSALDDPSQKLIERILQSGNRAAELVSQLMAFSRKQVLEPKVLNLNDIVTDTQKMLRRIIGENTEMETLLAPNLWPIKADRTQIEQIIVNLAVNARDAMPDGGQLTLSTTNVILDEEYTAVQLNALPGDYVCLAVSDTGVGMTQEVQEHIFEPFFTTKQEGKGSGLGLAMVLSIVTQSKGHITVNSQPGAGTIFKIYLPKSSKMAVSSLPGHDAHFDLPPGTETVLLAEDEAAVRQMAAYTLRQQGYTVLEAANGDQALRLAREYNLEIQLLITDVVMPQMNGKVLADQIQAMRPATKTLFTSGYTDDAIVQHGILKPGIAFLPKPFSPATLICKVRETLDKLQ